MIPYRQTVTDRRQSRFCNKEEEIFDRINRIYEIMEDGQDRQAIVIPAKA